MIEFVGIGDLHLSSTPKLEDHDAYVLRLLKQPLKFARQRGIKHIFLYGDIAEKPWLSRSATLALLRLFKQPFNFHIILGNHDKEAEASSQGHSLLVLSTLISDEKLDNVKIYEEDTLVRLGNAPVHFMPWPSENFKDNCLNVAHVTVSGTRYNGVVANVGHAGKQLAVIGHEHDNQRVRNCYYSGTLYQTNFGESPEKFFHHIVFDDGEFTVKSVKVKNERTLYTVSSKADIKDLPALGPHDKVKVQLRVGSDLQASDYANLQVSKVEASLALQPVEGSSVDFNTTEFFDEWLEGQNLTDKKRNQLKELRNGLLRS